MQGKYILGRRNSIYKGTETETSICSTPKIKSTCGFRNKFERKNTEKIVGKKNEFRTEDMNPQIEGIY